MSKKDDGKKNELTRKETRVILASLDGKSVTKLTKTEMDLLITSIGQLLGVIDETGKVKL